MRKLISLGLASLSLSAVVSSAQRGAAMPAIPAPAPVMHAMPAPAAGMHAPVTGTQARVAGNHLVSPRGSGAAHPGTAHSGASPARTGTRVSGPASKPNALPHKPATTSGFPITPTPPHPGKPFIPGFLPGDTFTGQSCFLSSNCYPVPGFGFDYEHFFAVHPNWGKFHPVANVVIPGWGGGFYYPMPYYTESTPQEGQEEASAPSQPQQESNVRASVPATEETTSTTSRSYSYLPAQPVEEYVFVKRDGTRIFAVAYSLLKDKLQYITKEGLRRTLPLDALDYDATMKSNDERGNTVTLPGVPPAAMAMAR
jgi:hypothetical protein